MVEIEVDGNGAEVDVAAQIRMHTVQAPLGLGCRQQGEEVRQPQKQASPLVEYYPVRVSTYRFL